MGKLTLFLMAAAAIIAALVGLWYLVAFIVHTTGHEDWRWLSEVDRVRLVGEVRGFGAALFAGAIVGAKFLFDRRKRQEQGESEGSERTLPSGDGE